MSRRFRLRPFGPLHPRRSGSSDSSTGTASRLRVPHRLRCRIPDTSEHPPAGVLEPEGRRMERSFACRPSGLGGSESSHGGMDLPRCAIAPVPEVKASPMATQITRALQLFEGADDAVHILRDCRPAQFGPPLVVAERPVGRRRDDGLDGIFREQLKQLPRIAAQQQGAINGREMTAAAPVNPRVGVHSANSRRHRPAPAAGRHGSGTSGPISERGGAVVIARSLRDGAVAHSRISGPPIAPAGGGWGEYREGAGGSVGRGSAAATRPAILGADRRPRRPT